MKKLIIFLALLFIPFIAKAEVKISDAILVESTDGLEVAEKPNFEGLQLEIDMKLAEVGEYAKYKLTIANDTKKDYEIDMGEAFSEKEYIKYEFSFVDEDNSVLKSNDDKDIYVTVTYNKEVPEEEFVNGVYKDDNVMTINLSTEEEQQENPSTKVGYGILATAIILLVALLLVLFNKYKLDHLLVLFIAIAVALPISIFALEKITIKIQAKIQIVQKEPQFCVKTIKEYSGQTTTNYYNFSNGMTWQEYLNSDYNQNYFAPLDRDPDNITLYEDKTNVCHNVLFTEQEYEIMTNVIRKAKDGCYTYVPSAC